MPKSQGTPERVIETLKLQDGLTAGEIVEFMSDFRPQTVYSALHEMKKRGALQWFDDRYYLPFKPAEKQSRVQPYNGRNGTNGHTPNAAQKTVLASYQQGRKGKQVMVISAPVYHDDVVKVELVGLVTFNIPMFGGLTICTGPDIPKLSPDQEIYRHLKEIKLHYRNGEVERIIVSETQVITIAPIQVQE